MSNDELGPRGLSTGEAWDSRGGLVGFTHDDYEGIVLRRSGLMFTLDALARDTGNKIEIVFAAYTAT